MIAGQYGNAMTRPSLFSTSFRNRFPFRLATTSFIYPDTWAKNARKLAPIVDEVELLLLESRYPDNLPDHGEIAELRQIAADTGLTYNVHLPSDLAAGHVDAHRRIQARQTLCRFVEQTASLSPSTWTLHLPFNGCQWPMTSLDAWRDAVHRNVAQLLAETGLHSRQVSVETLTEPFRWIEPVVHALDLAVCLDIGHRILMQAPLESFFAKQAHRIPIMHLHGVKGRRDHVGINQIPERWQAPVVQMLTHFSGVVSLEVFCQDHLAASLAWLAEVWEDGIHRDKQDVNPC
jgi:sugar phosphate isomerase/epimerase